MSLRPLLMSLFLTAVSANGFAEAPPQIQPRPYQQSPRAAVSIPGEPDTALEKSLKQYYKIMSDKQRDLPAIKSKNWSAHNKAGGGGGMDGGGGTLVKRRGLFSQDELLDLVNFPVINPLSLPKFRLEPQSYGTCSLSPFTIPQELTDVLNQLFKPLIGLNRSANTETDLIAMAIENFRMVLDKNSFSPQHLDVNAFTGNSSQELALYPGAVYIQGRGLILSQPSLARLSGVHQHALLVHEILRQISIGYELYISDQDLQMMTSSLLEASRPDYQVSNDPDFLHSGLPLQMYLGPWTKYIIRHHINSICAIYSSVRKSTEAIEPTICKTFATADINQMYALLPHMKEALLDVYGFANSSQDKRNQAWRSLLGTSHNFLTRQARNYVREMSSSALIKSVSQQDQECSDISRFLKEGSL